MRIMKLTRTLVMISGCFRPQSWTSPFKRTVYIVYRLYTMSMLAIFILTQFMDIVLNVDNPDDLTENVYMMLTISASFYKTIIMWMNYDNMAMLINCLAEEPFRPLDLNEMEIQEKFDKIVQSNTLRYMILVETTCSSIFLVSLFTDFRHRRLKYREWLPYDYSSGVAYCITYFQQMMTTLHCATVNVACDALFCALLMYICCQIEILEYRLKKVSSNDQHIMGYCIRHHNLIIEYARLVNRRFTQIIGFQYIASTLIICSNLYQLTKSSLSSSDIQLIMYTSCMLTQIFVYCWFGNKVKLKSIQLADNIFQMEWPELNNNVKKSLLIIMIRAEVPIEISTAYILTLNLDSFVLLLKTSYSVYNLLTRVQEEL